MSKILKSKEAFNECYSDRENQFYDLWLDCTNGYTRFINFPSDTNGRSDERGWSTGKGSLYITKNAHTHLCDPVLLEPLEFLLPSDWRQQRWVDWDGVWDIASEEEKMILILWMNAK